MYLPELKGLEPFENLVTADGGINVTKLAIDYVFNLPGLAARMGLSEDLLRNEFYKYTQVGFPFFRPDFALCLRTHSNHLFICCHRTSA